MITASGGGSYWSLEVLTILPLVFGCLFFNTVTGSEESCPEELDLDSIENLITKPIEAPLNFSLTYNMPTTRTSRRRNDRDMLSIFDREDLSNMQSQTLSSLLSEQIEKPSATDPGSIISRADEDNIISNNPPWGLVQGFGYFSSNTGQNPQFLNQPTVDYVDSTFFQSRLCFYTCTFQGGHMTFFGESYVQGVGHFQCFIQGTGPLDELIIYQTVDFYQFNFQGVRLVRGFDNSPLNLSAIINNNNNMNNMGNFFPAEADVQGGGFATQKQFVQQNLNNINNNGQEQQAYVQFFGKFSNLLPTRTRAGQSSGPGPGSRQDGGGTGRVPAMGVAMADMVELGGMYETHINRNGNPFSSSSPPFSTPVFPPHIEDLNLLRRRTGDGGFVNVQSTDSHRPIFLQGPTMDMLSASGHLQYNLRGDQGHGQNLAHGQYNYFQRMGEDSDSTFNFRATARHDDLLSRPIGILRAGAGTGTGAGPSSAFPLKFLQVLGQYETFLGTTARTRRPGLDLGNINVQNMKILCLSQFDLRPTANIETLPTPEFVQLHGQYSRNFRDFSTGGGTALDLNGMYNYHLGNTNNNNGENLVVIASPFLTPTENFVQGSATFSFSSAAAGNSPLATFMSSPSPRSPDRVSLRLFTTLTLYERSVRRNSWLLQVQGRFERDFTTLRELGVGGAVRVSYHYQINVPIPFQVFPNNNNNINNGPTPKPPTVGQWLRRIRLHGFLQLLLRFYIDLNLLGVRTGGQMLRGLNRIDFTLMLQQDRREGEIIPVNNNRPPTTKSSTTTSEKNQRRIVVTQFVRLQIFFNYWAGGGGETGSRNGNGYTQLIFTYYIDL